ncbi:MAG: hypothetical protein M5T61_09100 [Acidimicrobiia bacterium]|nr:hypothetical protein [Acidimicrobiia bacterium]
MAGHEARGVADGRDERPLTGIAVFSLLMFIFDPWLFPAQPKLDAVRASVLSRERYERLVTAERPWWERLLAPVRRDSARRRRPSPAQVSERDIVRAGFDPATLTPAEIYAASSSSAPRPPGPGLRSRRSSSPRSSLPCRWPSSATSSRPSTWRR